MPNVGKLTNDVNVDVNYAINISFPFRWNDDGDLFLDTDNTVIDQSITLISFTLKGTFPLHPDYGSRVLNAIFDPIDTFSRRLIDSAFRSAIETQEPRVKLAANFQFDDQPSMNSRLVIIPYGIKITGEFSKTRVSLPNPPVE